MSEKISIKVMGSGCPSCEALYNLVKKVVANMGVETTVEYVKDINAMINLGIMQSPALVINNKPVATGYVNDENKIKELIKQFK